MGQYAEIYNVYIDYSGGKRTLNDVMEMSVNDSRDAKPVHTMNKRRVARGYRTGPVNCTGSLSVAMAIDPEVDWNALKRSQEEFTIGYERGDGGQRFQLVGVRVTEVAEKAGQEGEPTEEVTIVALENRPTR